MKVFRHYETLRYLDALQMSIKISQENEEAWAFSQCDYTPSLWKQWKLAGRCAFRLCTSRPASYSPGFLFCCGAAQIACGSWPRCCQRSNPALSLSCAAECPAFALSLKELKEFRKGTVGVETGARGRNQF